VLLCCCVVVLLCCCVVVLLCCCVVVLLCCCVVVRREKEENQITISIGVKFWKKEFG
jgi:hypothetical protein